MCVRVVDRGISMKDVTFRAARKIAGGKAGMDDNSESRMLFFIPSNKGESLSSIFCIPNYQFWVHITIRNFVLSHYIYVLYTYQCHSVLLGNQIPHCCILQDSHTGYQILFTGPP